METVSISAGTELGSLPVDGTPCVFRTTQDVEAVPVLLQSAGLSAEVGSPPTLTFDFVSAGALLNVLTGVPSKGRQIVFHQPHHLAAELFGVVGLHAVASIVFAQR